MSKTFAIMKPSDTYAEPSDLDGKVDKVEGKGLSTNDYTNAAVAEVAKVSNAIARVEAVEGRATAVENRTTALETGKVDKADGKGLSTEDYTTAEKTKLSGIATGAQVNVIESVKANTRACSVSGKTVTIPTATTSAYGVTKLSSSVSSTSTTEAATPSAVRSAYQSAASAYSLASQIYNKVDRYDDDFVSGTLTFSRLPRLWSEGSCAVTFFGPSGIEEVGIAFSVLSFDVWDPNAGEYLRLCDIFSDYAKRFLYDGCPASVYMSFYFADPVAYSRGIYNPDTGDYEYEDCYLTPEPYTDEEYGPTLVYWSEYDECWYGSVCMCDYSSGDRVVVATVPFFLREDTYVMSETGYLTLDLHVDAEYFDGDDGNIYSSYDYSWMLMFASMDPNSMYYYEYNYWIPAIKGEFSTITEEEVNSLCSASVSTHNTSTSAHSTLFSAKLGTGHNTDQNSHSELVKWLCLRIASQCDMQLKFHACSSWGTEAVLPPDLPSGVTKVIYVGSQHVSDVPGERFEINMHIRWDVVNHVSGSDLDGSAISGHYTGRDLYVSGEGTANQYVVLNLAPKREDFFRYYAQFSNYAGAQITPGYVFNIYARIVNHEQGPVNFYIRYNTSGFYTHNPESHPLTVGFQKLTTVPLPTLDTTSPESETNPPTRLVHFQIMMHPGAMTYQARTGYNYWFKPFRPVLMKMEYMDVKNLSMPSGDTGRPCCSVWHDLTPDSSLLSFI